MTTARILGVIMVSLVFAAPAEASHSWGQYHWARTANPFSIKLGDSVTAAWDAYLTEAAADWSASTILDTSVITSGKSALSCRPVSGRGEVCSAKYGLTGWLGIAQIYVSGNHITAGTVKLNDTYFNMKGYNTPEWRRLVTCQEVGHIFGLAHQDENMTNTNLGTCMDYTKVPSSNQHPNTHDFEQLAFIYAHMDSSTTLTSVTVQSRQDAGDEDREWGREIDRSRHNHRIYERDLGNGMKVITDVLLAGEDDRLTRTR